MRSKSEEPKAQAWSSTFDHKQAVVVLAGLADRVGQVLKAGRESQRQRVCR